VSKVYQIWWEFCTILLFWFVIGFLKIDKLHTVPLYSHSFPVSDNCIIQPLLFNFALLYAIRKVPRKSGLLTYSDLYTCVFKLWLKWCYIFDEYFAACFNFNAKTEAKQQTNKNTTLCSDPSYWPIVQTPSAKQSYSLYISRQKI